nr:hypothetical protein [Salinicola tamaricis]
MATWTSSINLAEPMVAMLIGAGWRRGRAALLIGALVWGVGLLSVLSFSTLADVHWIGEMNFFALVSTVPPDIFLPIGGLLIAIFAAWRMLPEAAASALGGPAVGFRLWRGVVRYVSIPLTAVVLLSSLI